MRGRSAGSGQHEHQQLHNGRQQQSRLESSDDMTPLSEDTPYTGVVYHDKCYNEWGGEHPLLKYCGGESRKL